LAGLALWIALVVGLATSFQGISSQGSAGLAAVSTGVSEAIVDMVLLLPMVILGAWLVTRMWNRFSDRGRC
jgi:hypothetical protein